MIGGYENFYIQNFFFRLSSSVFRRIKSVIQVWQDMSKWLFFKLCVNHFFKWKHTVIYTNMCIQKERWQWSLFQNGKEFQHTVFNISIHIPTEKEAATHGYESECQTTSCICQNNKNSLKMINTNDPVTWNNQDLHSTKQDKCNKQAIIKWECIWRHFRKYSEYFFIVMN